MRGKYASCSVFANLFLCRAELGIELRVDQNMERRNLRKRLHRRIGCCIRKFCYLAAHGVEGRAGSLIMHMKCYNFVQNEDNLRRRITFH
jgi:hypothetical protein